MKLSYKPIHELISSNIDIIGDVVRDCTSAAVNERVRLVACEMVYFRVYRAVGDPIYSIGLDEMMYYMSLRAKNISLGISS